MDNNRSVNGDWAIGEALEGAVEGAAEAAAVEDFFAERRAIDHEAKEEEVGGEEAGEEEKAAAEEDVSEEEEEFFQSFSHHCLRAWKAAAYQSGRPPDLLLASKALADYRHCQHCLHW